MNTQRVSSSSSFHPVRRRKYDAFLSFYGEDTRRSFTDHLYKDLKQKGKFIFRDDQNLKPGELISSGLLKAIEESECAIVVLSPNFASSKWCLIELAKIVQCRKDMGLVVMPVFYHVDPSHVRHQSGTFAKALAKHEKNYRIFKGDVQKWRDALREVGEIKGWHIKLQEGYESMFLGQIVARVFSKQRQSIVSHDIVGIEFLEMETKKFLDIKSDDVHFIGFYGIDGVGKTTLAEFVYDKIFYEFEACSFISCVSAVTQSHGVVHLQRKILYEILMERKIINGWDDRRVCHEIKDRLRSIRVLIVLDDVNENKQLEALAGSHEWFGRGSRVIVTSKEKQVLTSHGVHIIHSVKELGDDEALRLFCQKAFKKSHPEDNFEDLSQNFVNYAKCLPGTLKVLGTFLYGKRIEEWEFVRDQLKENPERVSGASEMRDLLQNINQKLGAEVFFSQQGAEVIRIVEDEVDDFDDYDETPYVGGYDIVLTYGRPLPPSDEICYPRYMPSNDFDYDRPLYTSCFELPSYDDKDLETEYVSGYGRKSEYEQPPPSEYGSGYGRKSKYEQPLPSEYGSGYGRRSEYEQPPPSEYGSGYGRKSKYEQPLPSEYGSGYGRRSEYEQPPPSEYGSGYGRRSEYEQPPPSEYGSGYGRRSEYEQPPAPEYGSGYGRKYGYDEEVEDGYGRKKYGYGNSDDDDE